MTWVNTSTLVGLWYVFIESLAAFETERTKNRKKKQCKSIHDKRVDQGSEPLFLLNVGHVVHLQPLTQQLLEQRHTV